MVKRQKQNYRSPRKRKSDKSAKLKAGKKKTGTRREAAALPVCGGKFQVPWEIYHGVPVGWTREELVETHKRLGGVFPIDGVCSYSKGVKQPTIEQNRWFEYRRTLRLIADGVRIGDRACIELAVRYIELPFIGSYSGYIRALLARRLKHVELNEGQKERLIRHFELIVQNRFYTQEWREYKKLWKCIDTSWNGEEL